MNLKFYSSNQSIIFTQTSNVNICFLLLLGNNIKMNQSMRNRWLAGPVCAWDLLTLLSCQLCCSSVQDRCQCVAWTSYVSIQIAALEDWETLRWITRTALAVLDLESISIVKFLNGINSKRTFDRRNEESIKKTSFSFFYCPKSLQLVFMPSTSLEISNYIRKCQVDVTHGQTALHERIRKNEWWNGMQFGQRWWDLMFFFCFCFSSLFGQWTLQPQCWSRTSAREQRTAQYNNLELSTKRKRRASER